MNTIDLSAIPDDLIGCGQAAAIAHVHASGIRRWVDAGRLRGWRRGSRTFVSAAEVRGLFKRIKPRRETQRERHERRTTAAVFDMQCDAVLRRAGIVK